MQKHFKIAALEKADIQKVFRKFLLAYRSTPHSDCTLFSFMFGREMRTKLPQLDYSAENPEVARDRHMDYKVKIKMKEYADKNAVESSIGQGGIVVLENERTSKSEPNFNPEKYTVISLNGSDMVCKVGRTGKIVRRQVQFAKKLLDIPFEMKEEVIYAPPKASAESEPDVSVSVPQPPEEQMTMGDSASMATTCTSTEMRRSRRVHRLPIKLDDYIVEH